MASTVKQRYYVIFIDDYSRKCWIYFMQKKDPNLSKFCEFKALVKKEKEKNIKAFRSKENVKDLVVERESKLPRRSLRQLWRSHN